MATIFGDIKPLKNNLIVRNIEKGEQKTKGGIILRDDDGKDHGIRPRWAQVYRVGSAITDVKEGQWVYIAHGRWSPGVEIDNGEEKFDIRLAELSSILLVSDVPPEEIHV
jgi:co-chaperonin GroES (HSP10)